VTGLIALASLGVILVYFVVVYNQLVNIKHGVGKAWPTSMYCSSSGMTNCQSLWKPAGSMTFEQGTLEKVMQARAQVFAARESHDIPALGSAEGALRLGLGNLFAVAENYPDLKTNETFQHLQARISGLENAIADRREFYNENVNVNNVRRHLFNA
jgi:LemA protein